MAHPWYDIDPSLIADEVLVKKRLVATWHMAGRRRGVAHVSISRRDLSKFVKWFFEDQSSPFDRTVGKAFAKAIVKTGWVTMEAPNADDVKEGEAVEVIITENELTIMHDTPKYVN